MIVTRLISKCLACQRQTQHLLSFSGLVPDRKTILIGKCPHLAMISSSNSSSIGAISSLQTPVMITPQLC